MREIQKNFCQCFCWGGVRSEEEVDKLLRIGVDKVVINSAAVKDPVFEETAEIYGASTISVNIETAK